MLSFENIRVVSGAGGCLRSKQPREVLLNDVSGKILLSGTSTAILGPSGAGKTTLLKVLSLQQGSRWSHDTVKGTIRINGEAITPAFVKQNCGFVEQDSVLLPSLTPSESILFACNLRLNMLTPEERLSRANEIISSLGLAKCANSRVGNTLVRGISGGEKRRLSIALQLIDRPQLLFLDEPTTGLDSFTAEAVMKNLLSVRSQLSEGGTEVSESHIT